MVTSILERSEFVTEFWAAFAWTPVHQGSDGIRVAFASIMPIIAKKARRFVPADDGVCPFKRAIWRVVMKKLIAAFLITVAAGAASVAHAAEKVTVFAAASMKDVIEEAAKQIKAKDGTEVVASFASSSVLAKQIEQGAPAQNFISADLDWMDYVEKANAIDKASRKVIAGNALVIATQKDTPKADAKVLLSADRFSMGDPSNVPAGKYGKAALEKLDIWKDVEKNGVFAENVRVALQYVSRGEVKAAIVYASDRAAAPDLVEAYRFPATSHAPILYPAALIEKNESDAAKAFLAFLESDAGQAIIKDKGFVGAAEAGK
jgi:molybdate transport system substrate-binding protein